MDTVYNLVFTAKLSKQGIGYPCLLISIYIEYI
jgi:hypothetical protein